MQVAFPGCQMPSSSQLMAWLFSPAEGGQTGTKCRVEALGTEQKEQKQLSHVQHSGVHKTTFLAAETELGARLRNQC